MAKKRIETENRPVKAQHVIEKRTPEVQPTPEECVVEVNHAPEECESEAKPALKKRTPEAKIEPLAETIAAVRKAQRSLRLYMQERTGRSLTNSGLMIPMRDLKGIEVKLKSYEN